MEKEKLIFGNQLVDLRMMNNISQWQLSLLTGFNPTNLRKIEKGKTQAGVSLALRLILASGGNAGNFFQELANKLDFEQIGNTKSLNFLSDFTLPKEVNPKAIFGLFFAYARKHLQISQQQVATSAQYHLRNIYEVENAKQEPGVFVALYMVKALQVDIHTFFHVFENLYTKNLAQNTALSNS